MLAWIQAHAVLLVGILSAVVAVDTALASSDLFKSNSAAQAIFGAIAKVGGWILSLLAPKPQQ